MKFTKFGKALLMSALSAGIILGVSSCVRSYTVGFLYVTGTQTAGTGNDGIITGFKIDHNTGKLTTINTLPVASGGANPVRAVLTVGSRFLYVLNRGASADGQPCSSTDPCLNANITQFAVGGNGVLTAEETFTTQGKNPFRMFADAAGNFLYVLDHDAPESTYCADAILGATSCGDITAFQINSTTGRLSLVTNTQVSTNLSQPLTYFPVPSNPVDFVLASGDYVLTLSGAASTSYPYTGGSIVFPYSYSPSSGQLTVGSNSAYSVGANAGTAIVNAGGTIYVLDNEAPSVNSTGAVSQILAFSCCATGGALQAQTNSVTADDPTLSNPIYALQENKGKFLYVLNEAAGTPVQSSPVGGIAGFLINSPFQLTATAPSTFGTGSAPQCIVEDPSYQFIYTASANGSGTVDMRVVDPNSGDLNPSTHAANSVPLTGPATWCVTDGRTD
jgi:6-phosphogluconolactonase (cycloisomerase 2 family)